MSEVHSGIETSLVSTERAADLGACITARDSNGDLQEWVYVFNDEASAAFAAGQVIVRDPSAATYDVFGGLIAPATTHTAMPLVIGVAQHAIAAGSYGWIMTKGKGLLLTGTATVTLDTAVTTGGDAVGSVIDYADDTAGAAIAVVGASLEAGAASGTFSAFIDIR